MNELSLVTRAWLLGVVSFVTSIPADAQAYGWQLTKEVLPQMIVDHAKKCTWIAPDFDGKGLAYNREYHPDTDHLTFVVENISWNDSRVTFDLKGELPGAVGVVQPLKLSLMTSYDFFYHGSWKLAKQWLIRWVINEDPQAYHADFPIIGSIVNIVKKDGISVYFPSEYQVSHPTHSRKQFRTGVMSGVMSDVYFLRGSFKEVLYYFIVTPGPFSFSTEREWEDFKSVYLKGLRNREDVDASRDVTEISTLHGVAVHSLDRKASRQQFTYFYVDQKSGEREPRGYTLMIIAPYGYQLDREDHEFLSAFLKDRVPLP